MHSTRIQNENFGGAPAFYPEETSPAQNPKLPLAEVVESARQEISAQWQRLSASVSFPKIAGLFGCLAGIGCATSAVGAAPAANAQSSVLDKIQSMHQEREGWLKQVQQKDLEIANKELVVRGKMNGRLSIDAVEIRKNILAIQETSVELIQLTHQITENQSKARDLWYDMPYDIVKRDADLNHAGKAKDIAERTAKLVVKLINDFNRTPHHGDDIPIHAWLQSSAPQESGVMTAPFGSTVIATPLGPNTVSQALPARDIFSITPEIPIVVIKKNGKGQATGTLEVTIKNNDKDAQKITLQLQQRARCGSSDSSTSPQQIEIPANSSKKITLSISFHHADMACNEADGKTTHELEVKVAGKEHLNKSFGIGVIHFGRKPEPLIPKEHLLRK